MTNFIIEIFSCVNNYRFFFNIVCFVMFNDNLHVFVDETLFTNILYYISFDDE